MIKKILCVAFTISIISCGQMGNGKKMTDSGYEYRHVAKNGQQVNEGDYVYMTVKTEGSNGKVLNEMKEGPRMPIMQMPSADKPLDRPNPVIDMLMEGGLGDSMILYIPIDTLLKPGPNPIYDGMEYIKYSTYITKITDETGFNAYMEELRLEQEKKDENDALRLDEVAEKAAGILADYKAGKLDVQTTPEGLKYVILSQGDGMFGEFGRQATVHYYGTLMNGDRFDSSFIKGRPYSFPVGRRQVIQGWDLGIPLLKKGATAALFIPSELGYGKAGSPPRIPADSELMFYVELVDVI